MIPAVGSGSGFINLEHFEYSRFFRMIGLKCENVSQPRNMDTISQVFSARSAYSGELDTFSQGYVS